MTSFSGKIYKLRKINRALFEQLESNSVLLENKLRKLKERTSGPKDFAESCLCSSVKKQHKSWKMRNDSTQVLEVLNPELNLQSSSTDSMPQTEILRDGVEDVTKELMVARPSVKSKKNRLEKGTKHSFTHNKPERNAQQKSYSKSRYNAVENKISIPKNELQINDKDQRWRTLTDSEENVSLSKHKPLHTPGRTVDSQLLKEVGTIIDYSPKSTFLRRLKERSQRNICICVRSPGKSVCIKSQTPDTSSPNVLKDAKTTVLSARENRMKAPLKETPKSANLCCGCASPAYDCACSVKSKTPTLKAKEILLKQRKSRKHLKKKRVCYRHNCYCRKALRGVPSSNKKSDRKEKLPSIANEVDRSLSTPYYYRRRSNRNSPHSAHSRADGAALGRVFSVRDKEESSDCCTCQETGSWFNGLRKFRDSHWFDCHAKPICVCADSQEHRMLENYCRCYQEDQHTCVHQYVVNDRLFLQPVCADHKGRSRCVYCKLARKRERTSSSPQNKTDTSKEEVLVHLPLSMLSSERKQNLMMANKREDSEKSSYRRSVRLKKSPPPASSLALRFQKGMLQ